MDYQQFKPTTTGNKFMGALVNRVPFANNIYNALDTRNPKYSDFAKITHPEQRLVKRNSIQPGYDTNPISSSYDNTYNEFVYAEVDTNKTKRIQSYRQMAAFAELSDAIDEICDESISEDLHGDLISLSIDNVEMNPNATKELRSQWSNFIKLFNLDEHGWGYFRQLLIDGELFFENILEEGKEDKGIKAIRMIPSELINPNYANRQNEEVTNFTLRVSNSPNPIHQEEGIIPLDLNQVTYVHSGIWNEDRTIRLPYIENSRRAYKQLTLIEDSIIIYRIVRAPERLVFKVDVGNMAPGKAEAYLKKLMQQYWSRRSFTGNDGQVANTYEPQSMLDAYWFAKRGDSEGISVDQLQGGANLGELSDLNYFLDKLYKTLKVPTARRSAETGVSANAEETTREELRFAKFIMRVQKQFAEGLKQSYITHLKLQGIWQQYAKEYNLDNRDIKIKFSTPTNFQVMRNQQMFGLLASNFSELAGNESIADSFAQRRYLKLSDDDILENRDWLRKDAEMRWELEQISTYGPDWKESQAAALEIEPQLGGGATGGAGGGGGGLPDFGPSPDVGGETPEAVPDTDVATPGPEPTEVDI